MIRTTKLLPATPESHPFCNAVERCGLSDCGYLEEEYLFSGTANLYRTGADGKPEVWFADCTYTDRMILRCPENPEQFNGAVVVEIINSTANFDIERVWAESYRYLTRHGYIYVGITSKPNVFPGLKRFDAERYSPLNWPNPALGTYEERTDNDPRVQLGPADQEIGYIWDILLELPAFLKSAGAYNPLSQLPVRDVYLSGWSQSCSYINRLLNSFVYADKRPVKPVYDGYLAAGGVHALATPLNRYESGQPVDSMAKRVDYCPVPFIELNTESENSDADGLCGYSARRTDSDDPQFRYRLLEIAGSCHDAIGSGRDYTKFDDDTTRAMGFELHAFDRVANPSDYPKHFAFHLAWRNLLLWVRQGIAPMRVERIRQNGRGENRKDALGNTIGGLRTPLLDVPTARYYNWGEMRGPDNSAVRNELFGHLERFSAEWLRETYGSLKTYRELAEISVEDCIARGMLLPEDAEEMLALALARAEAQGLLP